MLTFKFAEEVVFPEGETDPEAINRFFIEEIGLRAEDYFHDIYVSSLKEYGCEVLSIAEAADKAGALFQENVDLFRKISQDMKDAQVKPSAQENKKPPASKKKKSRKQKEADLKKEEQNIVRDQERLVDAANEAYAMISPYIQAIANATFGKIQQAESEEDEQEIRVTETVECSPTYKLAWEWTDWTTQKMELGLSFKKCGVQDAPFRLPRELKLRIPKTE